MAGMFYSLKETAQKLDKTEAEVRQLAKAGKLREFRDGATLLFKIDEVEALLTDSSIITPRPVGPPKQPEKPVSAVETEEPMEPESVLPEVPEPDFNLEEALQPEPELKMDEVLEGEPPAELELPVEQEQELPSAEAQPLEGEEISLAPETTGIPAESDITTMDTALTGQGVSVLEEGDTEFHKTEDTMAETVAPTGTTTEASLEEIEEDVTVAITGVVGASVEIIDTDVQTLDTTVTVPDGGTLLLGGLKKLGESEREMGVPILSKIPIINRAFANRSKVRDDQTLLILIKPTVIVPRDDEKRLFPSFP